MLQGQFVHFCWISWIPDKPPVETNPAQHPQAKHPIALTLIIKKRNNKRRHCICKRNKINRKNSCFHCPLCGSQNYCLFVLHFLLTQQFMAFFFCIRFLVMLVVSHRGSAPAPGGSLRGDNKLAEQPSRSQSLTCRSNHQGLRHQLVTRWWGQTTLHINHTMDYNLSKLHYALHKKSCWRRCQSKS